MNVKTQNHAGRTPLHWAVYKGLINTPEILIRQGANINTQDSEGKTPFHLINSKNPLAIAKLLLDYLDLNITDKQRNTVLHHILSQTPTVTMTKLITQLLEKGAGVDAQDKQGKTPLHLTILQGNLAVVKLLLSYKAKVNLQDCEEKTSFHYAALTRHKAIIELLLGYQAHIYIQKSEQHTLDQYLPQSNTNQKGLLTYTTLLLAGMYVESDKLTQIQDEGVRDIILKIHSFAQSTVMNWLESIMPDREHNLPISLKPQKSWISRTTANMLRALPYLLDATQPLNKVESSNIVNTTQHAFFYNQAKNIVETLQTEYELEEKCAYFTTHRCKTLDAQNYLKP